ncbi:MAG: L,D-transpeptidase [Saprospiraceae bacterium]|nr:L,D-transpeptidase [Saprospiraceae bacterium]
MESITKKYSDSLQYKLNLYQLVNHNSWIIDSLCHTSYYWLKEKGIKETNQKERIVIKKGSVLMMPTQKEAEILTSRLGANKILVNIPEFKLRIFHEDLLIFDCPVRVGRNESKYLKSIDKYMDLRTRKGKGFVYNTQHNPVWINPADGKKVL